MNRTTPSHSLDAGTDAALKRALQTLPPHDEPAADVDALGAQVMAQWRQRHSSTATVVGHGAAAALGMQRWRRRLWVGTAGLAAVAAIATAVLVTRPDPVLEELMQPDVLSQMAIGEM